LNVPDSFSHNLQASVADFISDGSWRIPNSVQLAFPSIPSIVQQISIPIDDIEDKLVWHSMANGNLSLKEAYSIKSPAGQNFHWSKYIWIKDIPPSKSLLCWRLMHDRVPTDDNLKIRGCSFPSICSNCFKESETSFHLFFECNFAHHL
jgi:hypothetical protein